MKTRIFLIAAICALMACSKDNGEAPGPGNEPGGGLEMDPETNRIRNWLFPLLQIFLLSWKGAPVPQWITIGKI